MKRSDDILGLKAAFDIRVETLAANLLSDSDEAYGHIEPDDIYIAPQGPIRRRIDHDVNAIRWKYFEDDPVLFMEVNRRGMFDNLPPRLLLDLDKQYETPVHRTRAIQEQTAEARKFFLPFELAVFASRVQVEMLEQRLVEEFPAFMNELWGLDAFDDCLTPEQMFLLNYLIPEAYRTVGDWELTELIFQSVLGFGVSLEFEKPLFHDVPSEFGTDREWSLGDTVVLGEQFQDDVPTLCIRIKGVTQTDLPQFLKEGTSYRVLEEVLCSYFLPLDISVQVDVQVTEDAYEAPLGQHYLGYNVKL